REGHGDGGRNEPEASGPRRRAHAGILGRPALLGRQERHPRQRHARVRREPPGPRDPGHRRVRATSPEPHAGGEAGAGRSPPAGASPRRGGPRGGRGPRRSRRAFAPPRRREAYPPPPPRDPSAPSLTRRGLLHRQLRLQALAIAEQAGQREELASREVAEAPLVLFHASGPDP